ncbi:hypothetical protein PENSPDRAFT_757324 [Peniophora sp. CONT]|nr:hypothetical protein PENSPDRAFT_757324 [Peniophora sp. CONT]
MAQSNKLSNISILNKDCLETIFYQCTFDDDPSHGCNLYLSLADRGRTLVNLSHVCKLWRAIVLSLGQLWAGVVTAFPHGFLARLERARELPLAFGPHENWDHEAWSTQCSYLSSHIERFASILCTCSGRQRLSWIEILSEKSLPLLRQAGFTGKELGYYPDISFWADDLRDLHLHDFTMHFSAPKLTRLIIHMPFAWQVLRQRKSQLGTRVEVTIPPLPLIELLNATPFLTHLELNHCLSSEHWNVQDIGYTVTLECLQSLVIGAEFCGHIATFLSSMVIPRETSIRISPFYVQHAEDLRHLCQSLAPYMRLPLYDTVCITTHCDFGYDTPFFELTRHEPCEASISLYIGESRAEVSSISICQAIFDELPLSVIRHLRVYQPVTDESFSAVDTGAVFHTAALSDSVETLRYDPENSLILLSGQPSPSNYGTGLLPDFILDYPDAYPALRHIHISSHASLYKTVVTPEAMFDVKRWLEARIRKGLAIQSVKLTGIVYEGAQSGEAADADLFDPLRSLVEFVDERHLSDRGGTRIRRGI